MKSIMMWIALVSTMVVTGCTGNNNQSINGFAGPDAEQAMVNTGGNNIEVTITNSAGDLTLPVEFDLVNEQATVYVPAGCKWYWDATQNTANLAFWGQYTTTIVTGADFFTCNTASYTCTTTSATPETGFGYRVNVDCVANP